MLVVVERLRIGLSRVDRRIHERGRGERQRTAAEEENPRGRGEGGGGETEGAETEEGEGHGGGRSGRWRGGREGRVEMSFRERKKRAESNFAGVISFGSSWYADRRQAMRVATGDFFFLFSFSAETAEATTRTWNDASKARDFEPSSSISSRSLIFPPLVAHPVTDNISDLPYHRLWTVDRA